MDAILVFDPNNYLIHCSYNRIFLDEIARIAVDNKQLSMGSVSAARKHLHENDHELRNLIVLFLGPFVASIKVLQKDCPRIELFGPKSASIRIFYYEYLDFVFVYLNDVSTGFCGSAMQRKLEIFVELSKFLFGANLQQMDSDCKQTKLLHLMFQTWQEQKFKPMYLLEALERLIINPTLSQVFENLLQQCVQKLLNFSESLSEEIPCESFLFINDKLLCNHKTEDAPTILKSDQFLLGLLVNTFFKCFSDSRPLIRISSSSDDQAKDSVESGITKSDDSSVRLEINHSYAKHASNHSPSSDSGHFAHRNEDIIRLLSASDKYLFDDCEQRLLFLHSYLEPSNLVPFYVRFVRLSDEMALICLSELPSTFLTYHTHNLLNIINAVQYHPQELKCFQTLKRFEISCQKLIQYVNRLSERNANSTKRQLLCRSVINRVNVLISSDFKKQIVSFEQKTLNSQLEAICVASSKSLRDVLEHLVYDYHQQQLAKIEKRMINYLSLLKMEIMRNIKDYSEFLHVKSQRNITIDPYVSFIPNLVCFVFVDRSANEFVVASDEDDDHCIAQTDPFLDSLNKSCHKFDTRLPTDLYGHVVSHLISKSYNLLATGELFCKWIEGSHLYNYCIWFEDLAGNVLDFERKNVTSLNSFPNMTTCNFVEKLAKALFPGCQLQQNSTSDSKAYQMSLVSGFRKYLVPEIKCFELFYVQSLGTNCNHLLNYINGLKNERLNGQRLESLVESNIAVSKQFANKLNDVLHFQHPINLAKDKCAIMSCSDQHSKRNCLIQDNEPNLKNAHLESMCGM